MAVTAAVRGCGGRDFSRCHRAPLRDRERRCSRPTALRKLSNGRGRSRRRDPSAAARATTVPSDPLEGSSLTVAGGIHLKARYDEYVAKRGDELGLFQQVARFAAVERLLYPGSYVHITPSLVFDVVVYVDTDR
jgi:hypothetical protein